MNEIKMTHGQLYKVGHTHILFGNKSLGAQELQRLYPLPLLQLKQNHGSICLEQKVPMTEPQEADAHYTDLPKVGLVIKTADCMPIFIIDSKSPRVLGIHAGWRGVANQIVVHSIRQAFPDSTELTVLIGPYIQKKSFEVDRPVFEELMSILPESHQAGGYLKMPKEKFLVDLNYVLASSLKCHFPNLKFNFVSSTLDTVTDLSLHSYRRDRSAVGRNYSLIVRVCDP